MLENFSHQAVKLIESSKEIANKRNDILVGSEHLLIAMYSLNESICHFLLEEKKINLKDIQILLDEAIILRKKTDKDLTYTPVFQRIILNATNASKLMNSELVYEEHIFYSLLNESDSIANDFLIRLGVDIYEMKEDILDIFSTNQVVKEEFPFLTNVSKISKPHHYVKRSNHIERIKIIMSKKQKNNPMLIGSAGVGKTAIVEGLATDLKNDTIYRLDLGVIISGTKYRGELEEKIIKAMEYIKKENAILFIDEIHNIVGAGSNDGTLDIANILKPYLARSDIRCIGATTLDEYYRYIHKDKALMRRFQNIFIDEPSPDETKLILSSIKEWYEEYHGLKFSNSDLDLIINSCQKYLPERAFPDKAIDVMDEVGARYHTFGEIKKIKNEQLIIETIQEMSGINAISIIELKKMVVNYPVLKPFYLRFIDGTYNNYSHLLTINVDQSFDITLLNTDLQKIFGFKEEMELIIDLKNYHDSSMLNTLIGSTKGYVGYESGGILSEHIIKYPLPVIFFKNLCESCYTIQNFIEDLITNDHFIDNKGRYISNKKVIYIIENDINHQSSIGFIKNKSVTKNKYDITIEKQSHTPIEKLSNSLLNLIKKYDIDQNQIDLTLPNNLLEKQIYDLILK